MDGAYPGEVCQSGAENGRHRVAYNRISAAFPDHRLHECPALHMRNGRGVAGDEDSAQYKGTSPSQEENPCG